MHVQIITVGNKMPDWVTQGTQQYLRRFNNDLQVSLTEIPTDKRSKSKRPQQIIDDEGKRILEAVGKGNKVIALEVKGKPWTTDELAIQIAQWQMEGNNISLLIGGREGLSEECTRTAQQSWSLSPLTLPHPMVRVIVVEALYRAWSILHNHPYHRE